MLIASFAMSATKCAGDAPEFKWSPEIWFADSESQIIGRKDIYIKTSDPKFDQFICTYADEVTKAKKAAFEVINQCEKWKKNTNIQEIETMVDDLDQFLYEVQQ